MIARDGRRARPLQRRVHDVGIRLRALRIVWTTRRASIRSATPAISSSGSSSSAFAELATTTREAVGDEPLRPARAPAETAARCGRYRSRKISPRRSLMRSPSGLSAVDAGDVRHQLVAAHADGAPDPVVATRRCPLR